MAAKKSKAQKEAAAEAKLEKEQAKAVGAGREEAYDRVDKPAAKKEKGEPVGRDTPSALALEKVGNLDGEPVDPDNPKPYDAEAANAHGEKYQAEKKKHRWG